MKKIILFMSKGSASAVEPPVILSASITGNAIVNQVLTANYTLIGGAPDSIVIKWYRNGVEIATGVNYLLVQADAGNDIYFNINASNAGGSANEDSNTLSIFNTISDSQGAFYNLWSVAKLMRGAYYGSPIIRLRRTNDNAEQDFGVTTEGLLDEVAITTWVGVNSATVRTVYAQDGSARNFENTTPSEQPLFVNAGTIIKQGASSRPAMDFDGTKSLSVLASTPLYNFIHNGNFGFVGIVFEPAKTSDPNTIYVACGNYALNGSNIGFTVAYEDRAAVPANNALRINAANGAGANVALTLNSNSVSPQQLHIVTSRFDCDNATANNRCISYVDNSAALTGNTQTALPTASNSTFNLQWGSAGNNTFRFIGYSSEMIIDNQDRTSTNASVIDNLNEFYQTF